MILWIDTDRRVVRVLLDGALRVFDSGLLAREVRDSERDADALAEALDLLSDALGLAGADEPAWEDRAAVARPRELTYAPYEEAP